MPDESTPASGYPQLPDDAPTSWLARNRRFAILSGVVVLLGLGILILPRLRRHQANVANLNITPTANAPIVNRQTAPTFERFTVTALPDQDRDGLTDAEEERLGTSPTKSDSDADGLSDYDEVKIYHTDPLKSDSDSDGVADGTEVRQGTNPAGPGPLYNLNQAIKPTTH